MAFNEQGIAMLSSVRCSKADTTVSVPIMRTFVFMNHTHPLPGFQTSEGSRKNAPDRFCYLWDRRKQTGNDSVTKSYLIAYIPVSYIFNLAGSPPTTRFFHVLFQLAHSPKRQRCMASQTFFVKRAVGNPHKRMTRRACHTLAFPARMECSLKDEREQALFPCFPACKSSSFCQSPCRDSRFYHFNRQR